MKLFYINLASRCDRRAEMEAQLSLLGLSAERIEAITPSSVPADSRHFAQPTPRRIRWVSPNELACTFSHRKVWEEMLRHNLPSAVILEDDVQLSSRLRPILGQIASALTEVDLIKLETHIRPVVIEASRAGGTAVDLRRLYTFHPGSGAYAISQRAAKKLLGIRDLSVPVDDLLFDPRGPAFSHLSVRQFYPGLAASPEALGQQNLSDIALSGLARSRQMQERRNRPVSLILRVLLRIRESARVQQALILGRARWEEVPYRP